MPNKIKIKRALISVFDKTNILNLSSFLVSQNIEIYSTGGTYNFLKKNNIEVKEVSKYTKFAEILDGRVKTLHPKIHGAILAKRNLPKHLTIPRQFVQQFDYKEEFGGKCRRQMSLQIILLCDPCKFDNYIQNIQVL